MRARVHTCAIILRNTALFVGFGRTIECMRNVEHSAPVPNYAGGSAHPRFSPTSLFDVRSSGVFAGDALCYPPSQQTSRCSRPGARTPCRTDLTESLAQAHHICVKVQQPVPVRC